MSYQTFNSFEEAMEKMDAAMAAADAKVTPWQASLKPGDKFRYNQYEGEVLDPVAMAGDDEDALEEAALYGEEHMRNYRFCRIVGPLYPDGIMQDIHVSALRPL